MTTRSLRLVGILAILSAGPLPAPGQAPPGPRVDRYGDPLPEGAITRLGTLRLTHLGGITSVAISPDGKTAASGVRDGKPKNLGGGVRIAEATIRLWDVKTGRLLREIPTPDAPVSFLRFAVDGKTLFAGCGKFLACWECDSGKRLWAKEAVVGGRFNEGVVVKEILQAGDRIVSLHEGSIMCPVKRDGGASFHYHPQHVLRIWNARTGAALPLPKTLESTISAETRVPVLLHEAAFTPDLKRAVLAVSEGDPLPRVGGFRDDRWEYPKSRVDIVDLAQDRVLRSIPNPDGEFGNLAIAADGDQVAALTGKTIVTPINEKGASRVTIDTRKDLWTVAVDKGEKRILAKKLAWIHALAFVGKDRLSATATGEGSKVTVWRLDTGAVIEEREGRPEPPAQAAGVTVEAGQNVIRLLDSATGKPLHDFEGHRWAPSLRFALRSSDTLISRDVEKAVFWDSRSWKPTQSIPIPVEQTWRLWYGGGDEDFDRDACAEKGIYLHQNEDKLELRDLKTGKIVRQIDHKGARYENQFSQAGNRFMCQEDGSYAFFDADTGKLIARVPGEPSNMSYMWYRNPELSSHGKYFARTATKDRPAIELYDVDTGKLLRRLTPKSPGGSLEERGSILKFKFSPDESLVFGEVHRTGGVKNGFSTERVSVSIWNAQSGDVLQDLVVEPDMTVFWRETLGQSLVDVLTISHDGRLIALARGGGQPYARRPEATPIEIWEIASGEKRGELTGHGPIADLAFSPDDRRLASSSDDTTILIWDLERPLQPHSRAARLSETDLDDCWQALSEANAAKADQAIRKMIDCPDDGLPYLRKRLRPAAIPDEARVRGLIADLGSDDFRTRERAGQELAKLGELVLTPIERALKETGSAESQKRLQFLAERARASSRPFGSATRLREWRAIEILEKTRRPEATELLRELAKGAPDSQLTIAARAAASRAEGRMKTAP